MAATHLEIHVAIGTDQKAFVLKSPFEFYEHRLSGELLEKWLGVDGVDLKIRRNRRSGGL